MSQTDFLIKKAIENIEVAETLLRDGHPEIAVSRAYYAMFYIAEMLLFDKGLSFSSHAAVIAAFGKEFAKTSEMAPKHHQHLKDAFETRQVGDYGIDLGISTKKSGRDSRVGAGIPTCCTSIPGSFWEKLKSSLSNFTASPRTR